MLSLRSPAARHGLALLAVVGLAAAASATAPTFRVVARTGVDNAFGPNDGTGRFFTSFGNATSINNAGQVLFTGTDNAGVPVQGLFARWGTLPTDTNTRLAASGQSVPLATYGGTTNPQTYSGFLFPLLNSNLNTSGQGQYTSRINSNNGYINNLGTGINRLNYTADQAPTPDAGGANWASLPNGPWLNQSGQVMFLGSLAASTTSTPPVVTTGTTANGQGVWITDSANVPRLALRQSTPLFNAGAANEIRVGTFTNTTMGLNGAGRFIGTNLLQAGTGVLTTSGALANNSAIITNRSGAIEVIARSNTTPAVDASGATIAGENMFFTSVTPLFNTPGRVAFAATGRNAAGTTITPSGFYSDVSGTMRGYARAGTPVGTISRPANATEFAGTNWSTTSQHTLFAMNGSGQIAFSGLMSGGDATLNVNDAAIFRMEPDQSLTRVLRRGDVLFSQAANPLLPSDVRYSGVSGGLQMNASGEMIFVCSLSGTNVNGGGFFNLNALIGVDRNGFARPILRQGDDFDPGDGTGVRKILSIGTYSSSGGQDGTGITLNDNGQYTVTLELGSYTTATVGPGTKVTESFYILVGTIPAPGAASMLALSGLLAARRRRR